MIKNQRIILEREAAKDGYNDIAERMARAPS
jgi:hypothetical protein